MIKESVYSLLTADADLQGLMGGTVRLYNHWTQPNPEYPYMVYRVEEAQQDPWLLSEARLIMDLFDQGNTQQVLMDIYKRVTVLLDQRYDDGYRYFLNRMVDVPELERYMWHMSVAYDVRYAQEWRL